MANFTAAYKKSLSGLCGYQLHDKLEGDFLPAYKGVLKAEGGYVNDPSDRGGETFAGIARNANPGWQGWPIIDNVKGNYDLTTKSGIKDLNAALFGNTQLMKLHYDYTKSKYWDIVRGDDIRDQDTAAMIFDFVWASGSGAIKSIKAAIDMTKKIQVAGIYGPLVTQSMLDDINTLPTGNFYSNLYNIRERFFKAIVERNPSQAKYLKGWLNRLATFKNKFVTEVKGNEGKISLAAGVISLLVFAYYIKNKNK